MVDNEGPDGFDLLALGARVRAGRLAAGLSAGDLAKRSGISRSMVAAIEHGAKAPTVNTLHGLAIGLNTTMARLLGEDTPGEVAIFRRDDQQSWTSEDGTRTDELGPDWTSPAISVRRVTIPADSDTAMGTLLPPAARLWLTVVSGTARIVTDAETHDLLAGDSLACWGVDPVRLSRSGPEPCVCHVVRLEPA